MSVSGIIGPQIEALPIGDLQPNPHNARTHSKKQIRQIADSIKAFGFRVPVLVDEDNVLLAGHGRLEAARLLGMDAIPVLRANGLTPAQKRAYLLADNKISANAGWDRGVLTVELGTLAEILPLEGLDVSLTGFAPAEIDEIAIDHGMDAPGAEDELAPLTPLAVSQIGDLWRLGPHKLLCGDARRHEDVLRLMGGEAARAVFTDPPYNVRIRAIVGRGRTRHREFAEASGEMSREEFEAFLTGALDLAAHVSADGALHYVCMDWRHIDSLIAVGRRLYGDMINLCVWNKSSPAQGSFYRSQHELIGVFRVGNSRHQNNIELGRHGRNRSNVWTYPGVNSIGRERLKLLAMHPTVKPVALVADALRDCTARGDLVLDPFLGSGTTIVAAEKVGRRGFGLELDPLYVDAAVRRWEAYTGLDATLEGDGRTFAEVALGRSASGQGGIP